MKEENYEDAEEELKKINPFRDSSRLIEECEKGIIYERAIQFEDDGDYYTAIKLYESISDFKDSSDRIRRLRNMPTKDTKNAYEEAINDYNRGNYRKALIEFRIIEDYEKSKEYIDECLRFLRKELSATISAGSLYSAALLEDGEAKFTDNISYGQDELGTDKKYISISAGGYYTIGLCDDGTVSVAGDIPWMKGSPNSDWDHVLQVKSGFDYVVALFEDGTVSFQGQNSDENYNEILDFEDWDNIVMIDAGYHMVVGLDNNGDVHVTGRNASNIRKELSDSSADWGNIVAVATGGTSKESEGFIVGLKEDGTVITAGKTKNGIKEAEKWKNIKKISAGDYHLVGLTTDNEVLAVMNDNQEDNSTAKYLCCDFSGWPEGVNIMDISAGNGITLGVSSDGILYSCGYNKQRQRPESGEWKGVMIKE